MKRILYKIASTEIKLQLLYDYYNSSLYKHYLNKYTRNIECMIIYKKLYPISSVIGIIINKLEEISYCITSYQTSMDLCMDIVYKKYLQEEGCNYHGNI